MVDKCGNAYGTPNQPFYNLATIAHSFMKCMFVSAQTTRGILWIVVLDLVKKMVY